MAVTDPAIVCEELETCIARHFDRVLYIDAAPDKAAMTLHMEDGAKIHLKVYVDDSEVE